MVEKMRTKSLLKLAPDLFTKYKNVLYIGAIPPEINNQYDNPEAGMAYLAEFKQAGYEITIVEAYLINYELLVNKHGFEVYNCCIEDFETDKKYDIVFWWHGPEHVKAVNLPDILKKIEGLANYLIVLGCPWGRYKLGPIHGNPYQEHKSRLYPENFPGYETDCIGTVDVPGSNLTAVKWK